MNNEKRIFWIIGASGVGKSTIVKRLTHQECGLAFEPWAETQCKSCISYFSIDKTRACQNNPKKCPGYLRYSSEGLLVGEQCRKVFTEQYISNCENPSAPDSLDNFVSGLVSVRVNQFLFDGMANTLFVDGYPRKHSQIYQAIKAGKGVSNVFLVLCSSEDRININLQTRISNLVLTKEDTKESHEKLINARKLSEPKQLCDIYTGLLSLAPFFNKNKIEVVVLFLPDFKSIDDICRHINSIRPESKQTDMLKDLIERVTLFGDVAFTNANILNRTEILTSKDLFTDARMDMVRASSICSTWSRNFIEAAIAELNEMLEEFHKRWWSSHPIDVRAARIELIDTMHFLFALINSTGMTAEDFYNTFLGKLNINNERQHNNYNHTDKNPDDLEIGKVYKNGKQ